MGFGGGVGLGGGDGKKLSRFPKRGGCPLAHAHVSVIKVFGLFRLLLLGSFWKGMVVLEIRKLLVSFRVLRVPVVHLGTYTIQPQSAVCHRAHASQEGSAPLDTRRKEQRKKPSFLARGLPMQQQY